MKSVSSRFEPGPDLLGEVRATGLQHPRDLRPHAPRSGACSLPGRRSRAGTAGRHRRRLPSRSPPSGARIRRASATFGGQDSVAAAPQLLAAGTVPAPPHRACQHLAAAGLNVQRGPRAAEPLAEQPGVAPRRPLLGRPPVEPGEIPARERHGVAFGDQLVNAVPAHPTIMAGTRRRQLICASVCCWGTAVPKLSVGAQSPSRPSRPTVRPGGRPPMPRMASSTPGMNDARSSESCRIVRISPCPPSSTS